MVSIFGFPGELTTKLVGLAQAAGVEYEVVNPGSSEGAQRLISFGMTFLPSVVVNGKVIHGEFFKSVEDFKNV